jgi:hypothetical protein
MNASGESLPSRSIGALQKVLIFLAFLIIGAMAGYLLSQVLTGDSFAPWSSYLTVTVPLQEFKEADNGGFTYLGTDGSLYSCKSESHTCQKTNTLIDSMVQAVSCSSHSTAFAFTTFPPRNITRCQGYAFPTEIGSDYYLLAADRDGTIWRWHQPDPISQALAEVVFPPLGGLAGLTLALISLMFLGRRASVRQQPAANPAEEPAAAAHFSWWQVWWMALTRPMSAFDEIVRDPGATPERTAIWLVIGCVLGSMVGNLVNAITVAVGTSGYLNRYHLDSAARNGLMLGCAQCLVILLVVWITHRIAREMGGSGSYTQTLYGFTAFLTPMLLVASLLAFPLARCLAPLMWAYSVWLGPVSVKASQKISFGKALIASSLAILMLAIFALIAAAISYADLTSPVH